MSFPACAKDRDGCHPRVHKGGLHRAFQGFIGFRGGGVYRVLQVLVGFLSSVYIYIDCRFADFSAFIELYMVAGIREAFRPSCEGLCKG